MENLKVNIIQEPLSETRKNSFWYYENTIASIEVGGRIFYISASGEIEVYFEPNGIKFKNGMAVKEALSLNLQDKDLNDLSLHDGWGNNNWFVVSEIIDGDVEYFEDLAYDYDEALKLLIDTVKKEVFKDYKDNSPETTPMGSPIGYPIGIDPSIADVAFLGQGSMGKRDYTQKIIEQLKSNKDDIILIGGTDSVPTHLYSPSDEKRILIIDKNRTDNPELLITPNEIAIPYRNKLVDIEPLIPDGYNYDEPNKLTMLKRLHLSPEQIEKIKNSPNERMENENFEDYKKRREIRNLLTKYRGQF